MAYAPLKRSSSTSKSQSVKRPFQSQARPLKVASPASDAEAEANRASKRVMEAIPTHPLFPRTDATKSRRAAISAPRELGHIPTTSLSKQTRQFFEPRFGQSLDHIQIAAGPKAESFADHIGAQAFAAGNMIGFGPGAYAPHTASGQRLLAHEITHVTQAGNQPDASVIHRSPAAENDLPPKQAGVIPSAALLNMTDKELVNEIFAIKDLSRIDAMRDALLQHSKAVGSSLTDPNQVDFILFLLDERKASVSSAYPEFIQLTEGIEEASHSIRPEDEKGLNRLLDKMPLEMLKQVEKTLVTWPRQKRTGRIRAVLEMVTSRTRLTDAEESARGRFDLQEGQLIKEDLDPKTNDHDFDECLNFLLQDAIDILFSNNPDLVGEATREYSKGAGEFEDTYGKDGKTLARLASDLRIKDLLGPVNLLHWTGGSMDGHHDPEPSLLFERLSSAGDGWYFFLCAAQNFHTFIIAARVDGGKRTFFEIQGGQSVRKSRKQLNEWFDDELKPNTFLAGSKVWLVYTMPQP